MRRRLLLLPLLSALWAGSCYDPMASGLRQRERDVRLAIGSFAVSLMSLIVVGELVAAARKG